MSANAISCRVRITVDPCGRYIVWENEQILPLEVDSVTSKDRPRAPIGWHKSDACRTYEFEVQVPAPHITTPLITCMTSPPSDESFGEMTRRETPKEEQ